MDFFFFFVLVKLLFNAQRLEIYWKLRLGKTKEVLLEYEAEEL